MNTQQEIVDLNRYFLTVVRLMAQNNRLDAAAQFGLSDSDVDILLNTSTSELEKLITTSLFSIIRLKTPLKILCNNNEHPLTSVASQISLIGGHSK